MEFAALFPRSATVATLLALVGQSQRNLSGRILPGNRDQDARETCTEELHVAPGSRFSSHS